jgi:hypothetical protein
LSKTFRRTTFASCVIRNAWSINVPRANHSANVIDLALAGFSWDSLLDLEDDSDADGRPDELLDL